MEEVGAKRRRKGYLAEEDLVGVRSVHVGGVEKSDAGVDGVVDEGDHVGVGFGGPVESGHAHATEALTGDLQPLRAKLHAPNACRCRHRPPPRLLVGTKQLAAWMGVAMAMAIPMGCVLVK